MRKARMDKLEQHATKVDQLRAKVIDAIAVTMDLYGVNYTFGELYGVMFFEDRPMTLEEMQETRLALRDRLAGSGTDVEP